ncbi:class I SAM-dependent methyltransferase [Actinoplanes sp. NPDC051851]|uniref:class I SAM-dependent methyltransferase n=1 Tax=Actinoplanes sp. NPDC051851 TaxID=3154753 RepID=UPI003427DD18
MTSKWTAEPAADLAAVTALLEMAENLGLSALLDSGDAFTADDAATAAHIPRQSAVSFLEALDAAGLAVATEPEHAYTGAAELPALRHAAGYVSWAMTANRPYIDNIHDILSDPSRAPQKYRRDGRRVAVSSRWIGSQGFYQAAFEEIAGAKPQRIVDLGAGAAALVIHLLQTLPDSDGVAVDLSDAACVEALRAGERAGVADRLNVVNRAIESLPDDPSPLAGADVIHAGFVMHDVAGRPEVLNAILRACRASLAPGGRLVISDAVPYSASPRERAFSSLFTYLHASSMGVALPPQPQWEQAFRRAGFTDVACRPMRMPTSRLFVVAG